jgi:hypothetical protein
MFKLYSVRNNKSRKQDNSGNWVDVTEKAISSDDKVISTPVFNPSSVDICFEGHLTSAQLSSSTLFTTGSITAKALASLGKKLADANPKYRNKLQVVDDGDAKYDIVAKSVKGSTRKSKFRCATISSNGIDTPVTYVTVSVNTSEPLESVECAI